MRIRAFITPHKSEKIYECQDRFSIDYLKRSAAVSDGVSQSIFPDYWAELLVNHYVSYGQPSEDDRITLCKQWKDKVLHYISEERASGRDPWRTESNLYEGISAGATLCGISFSEDFSWRCDVLGDSCLISIRKNEPIAIYSSEEKKFDTYPDFLDSNPQKKGRGSFKSFSGILKEDDCLMLVSDPFSDYFQTLGDSCSKLIEDLRSINSHDGFVQLVDDWRTAGMHNDDSTVVIIEFDGSPDFNLDSIDDLDRLIQEEERIILEMKGKTDLVKDDLTTMVPEEDEKVFDSIIAKEDTVDNNQVLTQETEPEPRIVYIEKDLSSYRQTMIESIPAFVEQFVKDLANPQSHLKFLGVSSIIRYFFLGKKKRVEELKNLISTAANCFVEQITNKIV